MQRRPLSHLASFSKIPDLSDFLRYQMESRATQTLADCFGFKSEPAESRGTHPGRLTISKTHMTPFGTVPTDNTAAPAHTPTTELLAYPRR